MGYRLSIIISKIFMDDFETKHMYELTKQVVKNLFCNVEDTFVIIKNK